MVRLCAILAVALAAAPAWAQAPQAPEALLEDVVIQRMAEGIVIGLKTSMPSPRYRSHRVDVPPRIVIDLLDTRYAWPLGRLSGPGDPIKEIRGTQLRPGLVRLTVELAHSLDVRVDPDAEGLRVALGTSPPGGPAAAPAEDGPPAPSAAQVSVPQLFGVVHGNRGWVAYIQNPESRRAGAYRVGDSLGSAVVEHIEAESVTLKGPQGPLVIRLGEGSVSRPARPR